MQQNILVLSDEELAYIRIAVCDRNLKRTVKGFKALENGDTDGYDYMMEQRKTGHKILEMIDNLKTPV